MLKKIGSVSGKDVRHPGQRWRTSRPDTEPIPGGGKKRFSQPHPRTCRNLPYICAKVITNA